MQATDTGRQDADRQKRSVLVWIENGTGTIARGRAEALSEQGARVELQETPSLDEGEAVSVRISFDRASPIVATTGRVASIRNQGETASCQLEWNQTKQLANWIQACA